MEYTTGIRVTKASARGVDELAAAIASSTDFDPEAFAEFARQGNVREWLTPAAKHARARALLGEPFGRELDEVAATHAEKIARIIGLGRDLQAAMEDEGLPCTFLKGLHVSSRFYPDVLRRHQYDLDTLVHPKDFERAVGILGGLDFDVADERVTRRLRKMRDRPPERAPQTVTVRRSDGMKVDLHCRTKSRLFPAFDEDRLWRDRQEITVRDWTFPTLSDQHVLLLQTLSLCLDLRRGAGRVKHFLDLYLILRALDASLDWKAWLAAREEEGLLPPVATTWTMLLVLWACGDRLPELAQALAAHRDAIRLRAPGEAFRIVARPRESRANRAWFLTVQPPARWGAWGHAILAHGVPLLWRAAGPRPRGPRWPWEGNGEGVGIAPERSVGRGS